MIIVRIFTWRSRVDRWGAGNFFAHREIDSFPHLYELVTKRKAVLRLLFLYLYELIVFFD